MKAMADLLDTEGNPSKKVHALWVLYRRQLILDQTADPHLRRSKARELLQIATDKALVASLKERIAREEAEPQLAEFLTKDILTKAAADPDRSVRVHVMRVLGERPELAGTFAEIARASLSDPNPHVRRAAAETLGRHPDTVNIKLLLALRTATPADDTHLIHTTRIALRDQLLGDDAWNWLENEKLTNSEAAGIADVATGVHTAASARFLLAHLKARPESRENLVRYVHHVARYTDPEQEPELRGVHEVGQGRPGRASRALEGVSSRDARTGRATQRKRSGARDGIDLALCSPLHTRTRFPRGSI